MFPMSANQDGGESSGYGERLIDVLSAHPEIPFAYLYGSAVTGRRHGLSDIDVAAYVDRTALAEHDDEPGGELRYWALLFDEVQQALPGEDIDLVLLHRAPPLLADRILRDGRLLFSRDESVRLRWITGVKSRYCDLAPIRTTLNRALDRRIRSGTFGRTEGTASG